MLTGLPPEEKREGKDATHESLVDRLLTSPHFGEHFARGGQAAPLGEVLETEAAGSDQQDLGSKE